MNEPMSVECPACGWRASAGDLSKMRARIRRHIKAKHPEFVSALDEGGDQLRRDEV